jgi:hypothetical protein
MKLDMQQITHQMRFYISEVKRLQDQVKDLSAKLEKYEGSDKDEFNPDNDKHMEILRETQQAMKENSYGEEE